jgi:hypothetical protein
MPHQTNSMQQNFDVSREDRAPPYGVSMDAGVAYKAGGSVYFDTDRWPSYGEAEPPFMAGDVAYRQ